MRQKFEWRRLDLHDANQCMRKIARLVEPREKLEVLGDEPDNRILECAAAAGSDFIITEDRAMRKLRQHGGTKIVSVHEFLRSPD